VRSAELSADHGARVALDEVSERAAVAATGCRDQVALIHE
jgi:hypothetical protein